ncbi:MAG: tRNA pseudouridine(38-40) synthase TruA [Gammaproteobacteria bacterium]|nr:tRNA pseudouridine(38-40) synthase TruA [Gammaproteobacteria bacterium]
MGRVALGVEYDGTAYNGWQTQPHTPNVQDTLTAALGIVAAEAVTCTAAGRTDTGVHATAQVVHFDSASERAPRSWVLGLNSNLPDDIAVQWARPVSDDFHARYSATARAYSYRILNQPARSALARHRAWWVHRRLNERAMVEAAATLLGEHDFSAFRAAACQARTPVRRLTRLTVERHGREILVECEANAFLHHMVRNIVGTLVYVGRGEASPDWVGRLLAGRDRRLSGMTAPPWGLTLTAVHYPAEFNLPVPGDVAPLNADE